MKTRKLTAIKTYYNGYYFNSRLEVKNAFCSSNKARKLLNYQTTSIYGFGHPLFYENVIEVYLGR